jgi:CRP/FNR family transcriptional regulator
MMSRYTGLNNDLYQTLHKVMYKQMHGRLADTLLYINTLKIENPKIFQLLSRKDIADFAGISTESAIKLLKNFEKEGLIQLQEKDIRLINLQALNEISRKG